MTANFDGQCPNEGMVKRALGFFLAGSAQTSYTNGTHDPNKLPVNWRFIVHSLLSKFITDDLLRDEHYSVTSARIKHIATEMEFSKRVQDMAHRCRNAFSNAEPGNGFKQ